MSDRISGLTVTLGPDIKDEDAEPIIEAIKQLRGVISVKTHVADINHHLASTQIKRELLEKIWELLKA